ncbi:MAG: hypothetical protein ACR2RE_13695, partial [Geminicoccaceae bacterium]
RFATSTERMPRAWLAAVEKNGHGELPREPIAVDEQIVEMMLMGLRLEDGIDLSRLEKRCGRQLQACVDQAALDSFVAEGWLLLSEQRLQATAEGFLRLNAILCALLDRSPAMAYAEPELAFGG